MAAAEMTLDARRAVLTEGTRTAVLATTREDGRPHAAPIAFVLDDDDILWRKDATTIGRDGRGARARPGHGQGWHEGGRHV